MQALLSAENIRVLSEDHAKMTRICSIDSFEILALFIVFIMLYTIRTTIDYVHQSCFLDMLTIPVIYTLSEREWQYTTCKECIHLSKIENSS